jgi:hypothetical protein
MSYQSNPETVAFMNRLVSEILDLAPLYTEHMRDNFGEMLPHLLMADFARFAVAKATAPADISQLKVLLEFLERGLESGNVDIENVIAVSFAENLQQEDPNAIDLIKRNSGPLLRKWIAEFGL